MTGRPRPVTAMPGGAIAKKVVGATVGGGIGAVTADFVLWCIASWFFDGGPVPAPVSAFVLVVVTSAITYAGGWLTPRGLEELLPPTPRGDHEAD